MTFASFGVPMTVGGLGWLARTARHRIRLEPVTATVVRVYQGTRYVGYAGGAFTEHHTHRVEVVYNHPADAKDAPVRVLHLTVHRKHRPNSRLRLLVDPDNPDFRPLSYGLAGYLAPARFAAIAGPVAVAGLGLLMIR